MEVANFMLIKGDAGPGGLGLELLKTRLSAPQLHFVPRRPLGWARHAYCYWNVRDCVANYGGQIIFGWLVTEHKFLMLEAWHHAVWKQNDGQLLDISPHGTTGMDDGITAFLEDPRQTYDLSWPLALPIHFELLASDPRLDAFINSYYWQFGLQREYLERQRAVPGVSYDVYSASIHAPDPESRTALKHLEDVWRPKIAEAAYHHVRLQDGLEACQSELLKLDRPPSEES